MTKPKFQFDVLSLLLLTAIVALTALLIINSSRHSSQVRALQQRVQLLEEAATKIESLKLELELAEERLIVHRTRFGPGHPQVTLHDQQIKILKNELLK